VIPTGLKEVKLDWLDFIALGDDGLKKLLEEEGTEA
jgi:hypothetical protein